jgi:aspartate aminotransferase
MILISNPNNPTGVAYRREELAALLKVCEERDLFLVVDEAYGKILQPGVEHIPILSFREYRDHVILINTFSKTYAMTGWRLGYLVAPKDVLRSLLGVHLSINGPICTFVQRAGVAALRGPQECIAEMGAHYHRRGALMYRLAKDIRGLKPLVPQGSFYLYCKYEPALPAVEVRQRLWAANVAVRTGSEFGATGEGHLRLTYAVDDATIERGMALISQVFNHL